MIHDQLFRLFAEPVPILVLEQIHLRHAEQPFAQPAGLLHGGRDPDPDVGGQRVLELVPFGLLRVTLPDLQQKNNAHAHGEQHPDVAEQPEGEPRGEVHEGDTRAAEDRETRDHDAFEEILLSSLAGVDLETFSAHAEHRGRSNDAEYRTTDSHAETDLQYSGLG